MANDLPSYGLHIHGVDPRKHIRNYGRPLLERVQQVHQLLPEAVFVGCTAAWMHGLDVFPPRVGDTRWPVEAAVPHGAARPLLEGCVLHQLAIPGRETVLAFSMPITSREHTLIDCVRWLSRPQGLAAVDKLLRAGADPARVEHLCCQLAGAQRITRVRQLLAMGDPRSESSGESWSRCLVIDAGFPRPACQIELFGGRRRLDMGYEELRQAVEYDGEEYHGPDAHQRDRHRRREIVAAGWNVLVVRCGSILVKPDAFLAQLRARMLQAGWQPHPKNLERIDTKIRYICMCYRHAREQGLLAFL